MAGSHCVQPVCGKPGKVGHRRVARQSGSKINRAFLQAHRCEDIGEQAALRAFEQAGAVVLLGLRHQHHQRCVRFSAWADAGIGFRASELRRCQPPLAKCGKVLRRRFAQKISAWRGGRSRRRGDCAAVLWRGAGLGMGIRCDRSGGLAVAARRCWRCGGTLKRGLGQPRRSVIGKFAVYPRRSPPGEHRCKFAGKGGDCAGHANCSRSCLSQTQLASEPYVQFAGVCGERAKSYQGSGKPDG
jgi:hypothetical protein